MKKKLLSSANSGGKRKKFLIFSAVMVIIAVFISGSMLAFPGKYENTGRYIGAEAAKAIALKHAAISEAEAVFLRSGLDYDRGRAVYEIEFYSGNVEFEYEVDAVSGNILEYDRDTEFRYDVSSAKSAQKQSQAKAKVRSQDQADSAAIAQAEDRPQDQAKSSAKARAKSQAPAADSGEYIGGDAAKAIALSSAGLEESQVRGIKVKLERENGRVIYEVEFKNNRTEYEYEIDALDGSILKTDIDYDD